MFPHLTRQCNGLCHAMNYMGILISVNFLAMVIQNSIIHYITGEKSLFLIHTNTIFPILFIKALAMLQNECYYKIFYFSMVNMSFFFIISTVLWRGPHFAYADTVTPRLYLPQRIKGIFWKSPHTHDCIATCQEPLLTSCFHTSTEGKNSLPMVTWLEVKNNWHMLNIWVKWKILNTLI